MIKIHVTDREGQTHAIDANEGETLMEALREHDWGVAAICGGMCSCGTCHVYVAEPWLAQLPDVDIDEEDLVDMLEFSKPESRLSCQIRLESELDGITLELAPDE